VSTARLGPRSPSTYDVEVARVREQHARVVALADPDEHAGPRAGQPIRCDARRLERLPRHLEQQPLLRIGANRLVRRDAEQPGVELVDVVDETAVLDGRPAPRAGVPPGCRHCRHRVAAALQQRP
jgi:hypothetical protein